MDKIFVQVNSKPFGMATNDWTIYNGFSQTWDLCKAIGDFVWIEHDYGRQFGKDLFEDDTLWHVDLPIDKGIAYVSASLSVQAYQAYIWALKYPNLKIVMGGPALQGIGVAGSLPPNLTLYEGSVESYFGAKDWSFEWKLEHHHADTGQDLAVCYTMDNWCHHGKCIYCNWRPLEPRVRTKPQWEFKDFNRDGHTAVHFVSPTLKPKQLCMLDQLPYADNRHYMMFQRADTPTIKALEKTLPKIADPSKLIFKFGFEFPTERMLNFMQKGDTVEEHLETFNLVSSYGCRIVGLFITHWPVLIEKDVDDLMWFADQVRHYDNLWIKVNQLHRIPRQYFSQLDYYPTQDHYHAGPFYLWSLYTMTDEQRKLNERALEILKGIAPKSQTEVPHDC